MAAVKPSLASYARVAYARELTGDRRGATAAMNLALDAAGGVPEPTAWAHVELAKLALGDGLVDAAAQHVRAALAIFPGYVLALEQTGPGRRRTRSGSGPRSRRRGGRRPPCRCRSSSRCSATCSTGRVGRWRRRASEPPSRPSTGCWPRTGCASTSRARSSGPTTASGRRKRFVSRAAPVPTGPRSTATTRSGGRSRAPGRCAEAEPWLDRALRLGTKDALLYFHRGYAAGCAGDSRAMRAWYRRALGQSPVFSVRWAPVARKALA